MALDLAQIRAHFPALTRPGEDPPRIYLDNPGGTQVARQVIERITDYLTRCNANHGGAFGTSVESDEIIAAARAAAADFLNAAAPEEIVFGANMTTLTFSLSRALGRTLNAGDEIIVTRLDHDANIAPWLALEADRGIVVNWVDIRPEDVTLDMDDFEAKLSEHTKLVAVGYASNAVGTINPVKKIVDMAHEAGAQVFVDAVHYAPHAPIDVRALDCDFLACSAYKFFGPHVGILYGKRDLLEALPAYKVRPAPAAAPGKFETGTQNHEGIAGALGALEYLEWVGQTFGEEYDEKYGGQFEGRRLSFKKAMGAIRSYEIELGAKMINGLAAIPGLKIRGVTDPRRLDRRLPTAAFTLEGLSPRKVAEELAAQNIYVWDGNYYALAVMERLNLEESGGMVRVGLAHYNTAEEVERLLEAVRGIKKPGMKQGAEAE